MHPVRDVKQLNPVKMTKLSDTDYLFDFGQNMSGVSELIVTGYRNKIETCRKNWGGWKSRHV